MNMMPVGKPTILHDKIVPYLTRIGPNGRFGYYDLDGIFVDVRRGRKRRNGVLRRFVRWFRSVLGIRPRSS